MGERRAADNKKAAKWPIVKPKLNLQITRLKDNDLFTALKFCSRILAHISYGGKLLSGGMECDLKSLDALADTIWQSGLSKLFSNNKIRGKVAVGLNPNIRFYRYKVGQRFGRHIDESVDLGEGNHTHYTLLVYLSGAPKTKGKSDSSNPKDSASEPLVGGEPVFHGSRNGVTAEVAPAEGMALLHIHGDKCMLHES
ncbi:hypothetical protein CRYUN_Cryun19dG0071400 [Craigia yunnanensis]